MSLARKFRGGVTKAMLNAQKNRLELIKENFDRCQLFKLGLLTSAGYLVKKGGLTARAADTDLPLSQVASPRVRPFVEPLPIMPLKEAVASLDPAPSVNPLPGEGRTLPHQALQKFPPKKFYQVTQQQAMVSMSPDLPLQTIWGFDGMFPGPTYVARYGEPVLIRNVNALPPDNSDGLDCPP